MVKLHMRLNRAFWRDDRRRNVQAFSSIRGATSEITLFSKFQILRQELQKRTVPLPLLIRKLLLLLS